MKLSKDIFLNKDKILTIRLIRNIVLLISSTLFVQSCSVVKQYSTFNSIVGVRDTAIKDIGSAMCFNTEDSIFFYVEPFYGGKMILSGPPYLPVLPNISYPFTFSTDNKEQSYHIIIYSADSINICNIDFYRNKEKIEPVSIDIAILTEPKYNQGKTYLIEPLENDMSDCILRQNTYYRFSFYIRTFTTKEIEIKYAGKTILHVKRQKKLYHEIIFAS